jgi:lysophospholipase L1-like esterase
VSPSRYSRPPSPPRRARWIRPAGSPDTYKARKSHTGLKVATSLLGAFLGLAAGAIVFFTVEERAGIAVFCGITAAAFLLTALSPASVLWGLLAVEVALLSWTGWQIYGEVRTVLTAFSTTEGPVAAADVGALSAAQGQLDAATAETSFRLDLHEDEVTAVLQDALGKTEQPLRSITVDIVDGPTPTEGTLNFTAEFKAGGEAANGSLGVSLAGGVIQVEVRSMELGSLNLPGFARSAMGDYVDQLLESVEEINTLLAEAEVDVQAITIGDDRLVVTGVQRGGPEVTATSLLTDLAAAAAASGPSEGPPAEVIGPGTVNGTFAEGAVYYLALGDSLAANVGAPSAQDGYVSRLHRWLEERDGRRYGLLNLGVPGETSGSLLAGGQLDEALGFLAVNRVAYITVDVGANDLLGHLTSPECSADLDAVACRARLDGALAAYEENLPAIFAALREAAPQATIVLLTAYNPFSLGTGIAFEEDTSRTLDSLNDVAESAAAAAGVLVADGFTPMQGVAAYTTLMLDSPPDIHPNALGYDVLAQALVAALG